MQFAAVSFLELEHPEFYDPKYGCRLHLLRELLRQTPGRELAVVLGSSRAEQGFRPGLLTRSTSDLSPVLFNLARGGSSPLLHLLTLKRLLADGIHPNRIYLEIFPPSLVMDEDGATLVKTTLRDFPLLDHYPLNWRTYGYFLRDRALLWHRYRDDLLAQWAPAWMSPLDRWREHLWNRGSGEWRTISEGVTSQERRDLIDDAYRRYAHKLQNFRIGPAVEQALQELFGLCRSEGIEVVLFLMPEASEFRSWYPQTTQAKLTHFLKRLEHEQGLPIIDARTWISDNDFWDSHHLLYRGAADFTHRFAAKALPSKMASGDDILRKRNENCANW